MENYEQKYKESLSRAKQCYEGNSIYVLPKKDLEYIFPELKDSDDERIRKALISVFSNREKYLIDQSFGDITVSEALAWLEKQCEQKPVDKAQPKFKDGDWITNGICIIKITSVEDRYYWHDNDCVGGDIESIDKEYHLWTIQDAKNGDVLTYHVGDGKTLIFIYDCLGKSFDGEVCCHALLDEDYFSGSVGSVCCKYMEHLTPATKEQRDLLFSKMKEAGYEWDADKKELKERIKK